MTKRAAKRTTRKETPFTNTGKAIERKNMTIITDSLEYFACKTLADLKEAIRWILKDTAFGEATAFVDCYDYVTFRSLKTLDREFNYYYGA